MNYQPTNQPPEGRVFIADFEKKVVREKEYVPMTEEDYNDSIPIASEGGSPYKLKQYPATWLTKEMDGKEMVEGVDFEIKEKYEPHSAYGSKENQNRDNPIVGFMVKVAIHISAPPDTVIQKETIEYCDVCGVTDRCAEYQQEGSCDSIRKTVVESPTVIQPLGLQKDIIYWQDIKEVGYPEADRVVEVWIEENEMPFMAMWRDSGFGFSWHSESYEVQENNDSIRFWRGIRLDYPGQSTPPPQPLGIDVEDMAKASLRETFNKWTGKTCTDDQWYEYLEKESIQLTLAAMIHFKAGYAASKSTSEEEKDLVKQLMYFIEEDGKPVDGFRFREIALELKYKISKR